MHLSCGQPLLYTLLTCRLLFTECSTENPNPMNNVLLEPESDSFPGEQSLGAGRRLPVNHPTLQISVGVNRHSKAGNPNVPGSFLWFYLQQQLLTSQLVLCGACRKAGMAWEEHSMLWDCSQHPTQREMSPVGGIGKQRSSLWGMQQAMLVERGFWWG